MYQSGLINMWVKVILGLHFYILLVAEATGHHQCTVPSFEGDYAYYPKTPLTFKEMRYAVLGVGTTSRTYYEVYSMDPTALKIYGLPILRKVAIQWILASDEREFPGSFTNSYTGWNPYNSTHPCERGTIVFDTIYRTDMPYNYMGFRFLSVYPTPEVMVGTTFSSCPERYLINWYCPENKLEYDHKWKGMIKKCIDGARMSIYSSTGPNNMPWDLILEDLCRNHSPKMDDKRWTMTHDAPEQCKYETGNRKKREDTSGIRHYL